MLMTLQMMPTGHDGDRAEDEADFRVQRGLSEGTPQ